MRRKAILPWTYGFFILNLAVFAALVLACPGNVWTARSFYVWLSVFNLLTVSVAWSVLSDVMKPGQMKRLFALVASGSSLGAMAGPAVTAALAGVAGLLWLFLAAAVFLALAMLAGMYLHRWRDGNSPEDAETGVRLPADCRERLWREPVCRGVCRIPVSLPDGHRAVHHPAGRDQYVPVF